MCNELLVPDRYGVGMQYLHAAYWLAVKAIAVWFPCWAFRRYQELDRPLDSAARVVRWSIVLGCWLIATVMAGGGFRGVQVAFRLLGLAFLCWPNFAWHLRFIRNRPADA
jgi:hypothetical protein